MVQTFILYNPHSSHGSEAAEELFLLMPDELLSPVDMTTVVDYGVFFKTLLPEDRIVICGGDGTLNRFVNDAGHLPSNDILYYPCGTGNDFSRDLGKGAPVPPFSIRRYLTALPTVTIKRKTQHFLNGVGFGLDGYCCEQGDDLRKESDKPVNYSSIAVKGLLMHYEPTNALVRVDGTSYEFDHVWIAPTMNGRYYGGGMMAAPAQRRNCGTVTLVVMHGKSRIRTLMAFPSIFRGEHIRHTDLVSVFSARVIEVEFDRSRPLQIDGETVPGVRRYTVTAGHPRGVLHRKGTEV